jgi:aminoglycoside phosphotransferase (APT) family kinase protein
VLVDLATMVTPHLAALHLHPIVGSRFELEVVAYRPTERAVVRVRGEHREIYVKVVPPATTTALVARHVILGEAGLPVPPMIAAGDGWVAMEALVGTTLRDRLKQGADRLPPPQRYGELLDALAAIDLPQDAPVRSRVDDARHHAAMLATVLPSARTRLDEIVERLSVPASSERARGTVHGDLHEAQMVVDDHRVTGLLDIDDVGPGDPLDDVGTLVAHLAFRAMTSGDERIRRYGQSVRSALAGAHDVADLDRHVAAVLVGLATGPFRVQQPEWASTTSQVLDLVEDHLAASGATAGAATR